MYMWQPDRISPLMRATFRYCRCETLARKVKKCMYGLTLTLCICICYVYALQCIYGNL